MNPDTSKQERLEDCRREVRFYLAERPSLAFRSSTIQRFLAIEFDFSLDEVTAALSFLVSAQQVEVEPVDIGASLHYKITAAGTLAKERGR